MGACTPAGLCSRHQPRARRILVHAGGPVGCAGVVGTAAAPPSRELVVGTRCTAAPLPCCWDSAV